MGGGNESTSVHIEISRFMRANGRQTSVPCFANTAVSAEDVSANNTKAAPRLERVCLLRRMVILVKREREKE